MWPKNSKLMQEIHVITHPAELTSGFLLHTHTPSYKLFNLAVHLISKLE